MKEVGGVPRTLQAVAHSDAVERLTYAAVTRDTDAIAAALDALAATADLPQGEVADETRQAAIDADPIVAAGLGWLTLPELETLVMADPDSYLTDDERAFIDHNGSHALRFVVRHRALGEPLPAHREAAGGAPGRAKFALAARGRSADWKKVRALLVDQGIIDEADDPADR